MNHEFEATRPHNLEYVLERDGALLEELARPGAVLTRERLAEIESAMGVSLLDAVDQAEASGIPWPDERTGMRVVAGGHVERHIENEQSDREFAQAVMAEGGRAFNNFSALLHAVPIRPEADESPSAFFAAHPSMLDVTYGTKPYLWRSHAIAKDFMEALQHEVAVVGEGGMSNWKDRIIQGMADPEGNPHDAAVLRASRIAYVLFINLMRSDDPELQYEWLGMGGAAEITDPEEELWT